MSWISVFIALSVKGNQPNPHLERNEIWIKMHIFFRVMKLRKGLTLVFLWNYQLMTANALKLTMSWLTDWHVTKYLCNESTSSGICPVVHSVDKIYLFGRVSYLGYYNVSIVISHIEFPVEKFQLSFNSTLILHLSMISGLYSYSACISQLM